jgi:hypothetical protein
LSWTLNGEGRSETINDKLLATAQRMGCFDGMTKVFVSPQWPLRVPRKLSTLASTVDVAYNDMTLPIGKSSA